ncbi:MAG: propionate kinase [Candidatus Accumulibacter sp. BA-94]|nr:MAG: propionate kinase [Candidatus Accumulibacter sp. BA-94]
MAKALLVINAGSSSIKFSVFALPPGDGDLQLLCRGVQENIGEENPRISARKTPILKPSIRPDGSWPTSGRRRYPARTARRGPTTAGG